MEGALHHLGDGRAAGRASSALYVAAVGLDFLWQRLGRVVIGDGR